MKICIIDDDKVYKMLVSRTIEKVELSDDIISFSDGEEAYQYFEQNSKNKELLPDIVLLDINMPIMDGWDFLEEYRSIKSDLAKQPTIYMVSSSVDEADMSRCKTYHEVKEYITKPIHFDKLFSLKSSAA